MDMATFVSILALFVAVFSACSAHRSADSAQRTAEGALLHQVLVDVIFEYKTAEMFNAVQSLWRFAREHEDNFDNLVSYYKAKQKEDEEHIQTLPTPERLEYEKTTLHYQRRLVSQFYTLLGRLYEQEVIPKKIFCTYWSESDLRILPQILIPIEKSTAPNSPDLPRLQRLYDVTRGNNSSSSLPT